MFTAFSRIHLLTDGLCRWIRNSWFAGLCMHKKTINVDKDTKSSLRDCAVYDIFSGISNTFLKKKKKKM